MNSVNILVKSISFFLLLQFGELKMYSFLAHPVHVLSSVICFCLGEQISYFSRLFVLGKSFSVFVTLGPCTRVFTIHVSAFRCLKFNIA